MKRSFVFVPILVLATFLLNSFFVPKVNEAKKKPIKETKSSPISNIIFKSADGGQTWQDISKGLPEKLQKEGLQGDAFFANNTGFYLRAGNGIYHDKPNPRTTFWRRENFPGKRRNIVSGRNGMYAYSYRGQFLQKRNGASDWSPVFTDFQEQAIRIDSTKDWAYEKFHEKEVRTFFETAEGTIFVGSNNSLFKSTNHGKTWKLVYGGWLIKIIESNGVLLATTKEGILRSTDDGESWNYVLNEGGIGITVEPIAGGFAAIAYNPIIQTNRIHISSDGGRTWNITAEALQPSWNDAFIKQLSGIRSLSPVLSIKQAGNYLVCSRSDGLFRSSDMGKTWKLILSSDEKKFLQLSVSGNVIYAVSRNTGC